MAMVLTSLVALGGIGLAAHIFATVGRRTRGDARFVAAVRGSVETPRPVKRVPLRVVRGGRA